jgi:transcriptional regulator of acetoin/glycerol metabolism
LLQYEWPGNVRELENAVERAVALGSEGTLDLRDLPPALHNGHAAEPVLEPIISLPKPAVSDTDLEELERVTIQRVFEQVNGDKALAGKMLGISRATLYRKLKRYNIGLAKSASAAS